MEEPILPGDESGQTNPFSSPDELFQSQSENSSRMAWIDLTVPISSEERERLGLHLRYEIDRYLQDTAPRRGNVEQWRRDYELYPAGRGQRWPGCADVCSPLTHIYCQNHYTRLNQQIIKADPPFACVAKKPDAQLYAPMIEEALIAILEEAQWETVADQLHSELPVVGNCFLRVTYEQTWIRSPRFQYDWNAERFESIVNTGGDQLDAFFQAVETDEEGLPKIGLAWENQLQHSGVAFKVVPWEDGIVLPATCRDPKEAYGIGERLMIRGAELEMGVKNGKYFADAVEKIMERHASQQPMDRSERLAVQGISPDAGPTTFHGNGFIDPKYKEFLCYELCWQMDADGDGQMEWVIVTLEWETGTILRLQYMPYQHGRPYYILFRYHTRARELFGMSVAEKLASLQDAATAIMNQIIDHADLMLNFQGNFFYDGTSGFDPDKNQVLLGRPIRVDNVDGIKVIELPQLSPEHYNVYQLIKDQADLITASSNPSLGKATDTTKTLGEVQIVAASSNMIFEEVASGVARSWADAWDQARWLSGQFGENAEVKYRISAAPGHQIMAEGQQQPVPAAQVQGQMVPAPGGVAFGAIPAEILLSDVDLVPAGLRQLADMQSRIQQATIVQNVLLVHPLTAQNLPALKIGLDYFLQQTMYGPRERIMAEVEQWMQAQMLAAQLGMGISAAGGALGGGPEPGQDPGQQGPKGNPGAPPDGPQPPQAPKPPKAPTEGATAQHGG